MLTLTLTAPNFGALRAAACEVLRISLSDQPAAPAVPDAAAPAEAVAAPAPAEALPAEQPAAAAAPQGEERRRRGRPPKNASTVVPAEPVAALAVTVETTDTSSVQQAPATPALVELSDADIRAKGKRLFEKNGMSAVHKILVEIAGVQGFKDLPADKRAAVAAAIDKELAAA